MMTLRKIQMMMKKNLQIVKVTPQQMSLHHYVQHSVLFLVIQSGIIFIVVSKPNGVVSKVVIELVKEMQLVQINVWHSWIGKDAPVKHVNWVVF